MLVVYFSSTTENTKRFVEKLGYRSRRIPLQPAKEGHLRVDEPFVLVCPTYGGGASLTRATAKPVPPQVIKFLNDPGNRRHLRAVIAGGNSNFGADYGRAGDIISQKCDVPYVYRFELMGNAEDVELVRQGLNNNAQRLGLVEGLAS